MMALYRALLSHIVTRTWLDHPAAQRRRRRQSVADMLDFSSAQATAAARQLARDQRKRGVKTIDTAKLPGSLGAAPAGGS